MSGVPALTPRTLARRRQRFAAARSSASASSASSCSSANGSSTRPRADLRVEAGELLERVAHARRRARGRPAPRARAASASRRPTSRAARRRAPTGPSARSRARAGGGPRDRARRARRARVPRVSCPRSSIPSTSSGRSSRRMRFETDGFERPTRSATSPSASPNSSISTAYARASSTGVSCSRATFSIRPSRSVSRSSASRTTAGHGRAAGLARGAPAALAGDDLVAARGRAAARAAAG